jgi:PAT family beta-lactamase induction signal transducer AmpG
MALGLMLPGLASGYIQQLMGYQHYFILTALAGIPGLITLFFIPIPEEEVNT